MAVAQVPIAIDTPGGDVAYPELTTNQGHTNVRRWVMAFPKPSTGTAQGSVRVPQDYASGAKIKCRFAANGTTGAVNVRVSTSALTDTEGGDASLTAEAFQSITIPGTAKVLKDVTFPASGSLSPTIAAGDTLTVKVERDGAGASGTDTATAALLLMECVLEYTTT